MKDQPIGIFDSGIGGLTVLREVRKLLPCEDVLYLGDNARVPYGTKSPETVRRYTIQNALFLLEKGIKALVVACNTASAFGLQAVQAHFRIPVIGVVTPGVSRAAHLSKTKEIGIIGTEGTIRSEAYQTALKTCDPSIICHVQPCSLLVALAEEGLFDGAIVSQTLEHYLRPMLGPAHRMDTLILGCTHYPLLKNAIQKIIGDIQLVDSGEATAMTLKDLLIEKDLLCNKRIGRLTLYSTDSPDRMIRIGPWFLGEEVQSVEKVFLD